jgi:hypothetical protein
MCQRQRPLEEACDAYNAPTNRKDSCSNRATPPQPAGGQANRDTGVNRPNGQTDMTDERKLRSKILQYLRKQVLTRAEIRKKLGQQIPASYLQNLIDAMHGEQKIEYIGTGHRWRKLGDMESS